MSSLVYFLLFGVLCVGVVIGILVGAHLITLLSHAVAPEPEEPDIDPPTVQLRKITVPGFGVPDVRKYDPSKFVIPLVCPATHCQRLLKDGDDYFEIPITDAEPGSVTGVHVGCVMTSLMEPKRP